jgi:hypothetical protein
MISSEVQRTLVKSPPELWAELSDPAALARHLGELGEIEIVRTDPESTVEWASENTTGTVSIKPSGWGTNVKLTVTRELAGATSAASSQPEPGESEPAETPAPEPVADEPPAAVEPQAEATAEPEAEATVEPEPEATIEPEPKPRRGFFARLFWRLRAPAVAEPLRWEAQGPTDASAPERPPEPSDAFAAVRQVLAPESFAASHPYAALPPTPPAPEPSVDGSVTPQPTEPAGEAPEEPIVSDISAELMAAEEVAAEEVTAVLTAVLDRLGAAHHRPFSRA